MADALALPGFTYGLDIVLVVGRLHLGKHQSVDEIHEELLERLAPLGVRISRREILYLFEASCTLLRASSEIKEDQEWLAQVKKNGGIIVSVDGIQPDKGNETIYLVRDALTGRVLVAEQVTSSETAVMKALLAAVVALDVRVLATITDAQESERHSVEQLWPDVAHQVCQFHALGEASRPGFNADRKLSAEKLLDAAARVSETKAPETPKAIEAPTPPASPATQAEVATPTEDHSRSRRCNSRSPPSSRGGCGRAPRRSPAPRPGRSALGSSARAARPAGRR